MRAWSAEEIWETALGELQVEVNRSNYRTWFSRTIGLNLQGKQFSVGVPNTFVAEYLDRNQRSLIEKVLTKLTSNDITVNFRVESRSTKSREQERELPLFNPKYTFDSFVVGTSNNLAYAAAMKIMEEPGHNYNPLYIHGGSGLGKTHLLHAIGHTAVAHGMQVLFVSAEQFTNELISAIREKTTDDFRRKYRHVDMLLVDDIQFIGGKEQTKENFFHTFNELHDANRQIAITSDCPPRSIPMLQDRLSSRFEWGLVTDIKPPDFETRFKILKAKAAHDSMEISSDVLELIALQVKQNIRALEGSLNRVIAYARLLRSEITPEVTTQALEDIASKVPRLAPVTPGLIIETVADIFQVPVTDIKGRKRNEPTVVARQVAMYLMRQETDSSLAQIGRELDGRSSATISYAYEKIANNINNDQHLRRQVFNTQQKIHSASSK